ncbi:MAG: hypothetical protein K6F52_05300 [Clostridia bacterium]|nr:hypothetical protein [Clostridia bacterium]
MFSDKLNFLMDVTNTKNSTLASAVSLDASHISRLRHGGRKLPQSQNFLMPMAVYLTKRVKDDYQKKIIMDALKLDGEWSEKESLMADIIYKWLKSNDDEAQISFKKAGAPFQNSAGKAASTYQLYYGNEGRRKVIMSLLADVLEYPKPQPLYIADEEDLAWLKEDSLFWAKFDSMLLEAVKRGNPIISLHRLNKNSNEIVEEIKNWLPFFLSEKVSPFYYPKFREEIHKASAYIAAKSGFVFSHSVATTHDSGFSMLTKDKYAIQTAISDFRNHLNFCRPLLNVYSQLTITDFLGYYSENIIPAPANTVRRDFFPYTAFFPESVAKNLTNLYRKPSTLNVLAHDRAISLENLQKYCFLDIFPLFSREELATHAPFYSIIQGSREPYVTPQDYIDILKNTVLMLEKYDNYSVRIADPTPKDPCILIKENISILLLNQALSNNLLFSEEKVLLDAFWTSIEYRKERKTPNTIVGKENVIRAIKEHINLLESGRI